MQVWYIGECIFSDEFFLFYVDDKGDVFVDDSKKPICAFSHLSEHHYKIITYLDTIYDEIDYLNEKIEKVQITEFFSGYDNIILFIAAVLFIYISIELYI